MAAGIADKVGLPMAVENHFKYLVLLPQKGDPNTGAANHYYGVTHEGKYVFRGIELRRRDTAPYVAETQRSIVEALLDCSSREMVLTVGLQRALDVMEEACSRLRRGEVPDEELKMRTYLRRDPKDYKARLPHVAAAEALSLTGRPVKRGTLIDYVYMDADHSNPFRRVRPGKYGGPADMDKYVALVREAGRSILMPFQREVDAFNAATAVRIPSLEEFFIKHGGS